MNETTNITEYRDWLKNLKLQIQGSQIKAAVAVNSQLIMLYWDLGRQIVEKQEFTQWGSGFIEQLSKDLREEFPEMKGFSKNNLLRIRGFYQFYETITLKSNIKVAQSVPLLQSIINQVNTKVAQPVPQLENMKQVFSQLALVPWGHHILIMQKLKDIEQVMFYVDKTIENNWSRSVLEYQIETNL